MIDDFDKNILNLVQENSRRPLAEIAETIGLSVAATQKRLKKLRTDKVILKEVALVDPKKVGCSMTFIVEVELEHDRNSDLTKLRKKIADEPLIQQSYYVTGTADFVLIVRARDMNEFEGMTRRVFFDDRYIRKFTTSVALTSAPIETKVHVY